MKRSRALGLRAIGYMGLGTWWVLLALWLQAAIGPLGLVFYGLAGIAFFAAVDSIERSVEAKQEEHLAART